MREIRRARSESKKNREKFFTVYAGRDDEGGIAVWTHEANSGSEYIIGRGLFAIYAVNKSFERGILNDGERVDIEKTARLTAEELF